MGDIYLEHLVKKKPNAKTVVAKAGIAALFGTLAGGGFLIGFFFQPIAFLLVFAALFAAIYAMSFFNIEYEYILTNGELDIDIIYSKSRRKRLFSGEIKVFEVMCHVSNNDYASTFSRADVRKDYSGGEVGVNTYMFFTSQKGRRLAVAFEPNNEMLKAFAPYMGYSKLILKK